MWKDLTMQQRAELMDIYLGHGITSLDDMRRDYDLRSSNTANTYREGGSIHISPSKKGTFTAAATKHGMGVQEFASKVLAHPENYSPAMRKKANFARNSSKWHGLGGNLYDLGGDKEGNPYDKPQTAAGRVVQVVGGSPKTVRGADIGSSLLQMVPQLGPFASALDFGYDLNRAVHSEKGALADSGLDLLGMLPFLSKAGLKVGKGVIDRIKGSPNLRAAWNSLVGAFKAGDFINDTYGANKVSDAYYDTKQKALGGHIYDGLTESSQQMQTGGVQQGRTSADDTVLTITVDGIPYNITPSAFDAKFDLKMRDSEGNPREMTPELKAKIFEGIADAKNNRAVLPEVTVSAPDRKDMVGRCNIASNDAITVANGRPVNTHLRKAFDEGAKQHAAWTKEHPWLETAGLIAGAAPFAVAATPAIVGGGELAYPILTNPYVDAGITSAFAGHGLNHTINEGIDGWGDAAMTALELSPLGRLARPMFNETALAIENYRYPFGRPQIPENFLTIKPQVRTKVGDVEVNNPNLLYHLDRGNGVGAFSNQGAYVEDGMLLPGIAKEGEVPYSWWNLGGPYATGVNGQPMTRLMTATKNTPGMLHVRSQNYPIGQWNGKRGLVTNVEYVNPEGVDVLGSTYTLDPNYGWKRVFPEEAPVANWPVGRTTPK